MNSARVHDHLPVLVRDPPQVLGHGLADAADLGIPVPPVLIAVGAVVLLAAWLAPRAARRADADRPLPAAVATQPQVTRGRITLVIGTALLALVVASAAFGSADPATNPAARLLFVVGTSWLLAASALLGPVWRLGNPLRRISAGVAGVIGDPDEDLARPLPDGLGVWPAAGAAVGFVVAALVLDHWASTILIAVVAYVVVHIVAASQYGRAWYAHGDVFEVTSNVFGAMAPVGRRDGRIVRRSAVAGLAAVTAPPGFLAFMSVLLGGALLHAAGPSPSLGGRALQLIVSVAIAFTAVLTATMSTPLAPAVTGVVAGHLAAWLWAALLLDGPYALIGLSDPFARGWNLLGLTGAEPPEYLLPAGLAVTIQLLLLVGGHVLALFAAEIIARRTATGQRVSAMQFPFRALVVIAALAGTWLRLS